MKFKTGRRFLAAILAIIIAVSVFYVPVVRAAGDDYSAYLNGTDLVQDTDAFISGSEVESEDSAEAHRAVFTFLLDPGHGNGKEIDPGAMSTWGGVSYVEREINFKIATYLKAELEKYPNVKVYMTREGKYYGIEDFDDMAAYASSINADALISLHNNASDNASAAGCLVCVPNENYDKQVYEKAKGLATCIVNQLARLGLNNRGLLYRLTGKPDAKDSKGKYENRYPDGSPCDYYGIVRQAKLQHIPGIIVEHAFLTNYSDCKNHLTTDAQLKALAQADARGIVEYYGLNDYSKSKGAVTINKGIDYSAVYNFKYYTSKYGDIKAAYGNDPVGALMHFTRYGMKEGRQGCENFIVQDYKANYSDLSKAYGNNLTKYYQHYVLYGKSEKRTGKGSIVPDGGKKLAGTTVYKGVDYKDVYEYDYYIKKYADLRGAFGYNDKKAIEHFVNYGMKEGRQGKASFDVISYKNANRDLRIAFGNNLVRYYQHYMKNGKNEGRITTGVDKILNPITTLNGVDYSAVYDMNYYYNKYGDVRKAFGYDEVKLLQHFVNYGMKEGRQGKATFDVVSYRNAYRDLRKAFGNNLALYYIHYINYGSKENRKATGVTKLQGAITTYNGIDYSAIYDYNYYHDTYGDLRKAYGDYDDVAMIKHFATYGIQEWRQAKATYNASTYKSLREQSMNPVPSGYYTIMGTSSVTKSQMVNYFKANATYPSYYKNTDAPTLEAFCQIYLDECAVEGVKAEVAFAQMLLETGYLRFGGLVSIEDKNFAGMGATDSAAERNVAQFKTVREGVRAQVQHLKAYASKEPLKNKLVDPRFNLVTRGSAPYIEYLSIPNNPQKKGWASDKDYAVKIKKIISTMKTY